MWAKLLRPHVDLAPLVLRVALAFIFVTHGWVKLQILQDGSSWTETDHLSMGTQTAVAWGEFVCGLLLIPGLFTRLAALGIAVIMVGAIINVTGHSQFINIEFTPKGLELRKSSGLEINFAILAMCFSLVLLGAGVVSLDHLLCRAFTRKKAPAPAATGSMMGAEKTAPT